MACRQKVSAAASVKSSLIVAKISHMGHIGHIGSYRVIKVKGSNAARRGVKERNENEACSPVRPGHPGGLKLVAYLWHKFYV